MTLERILEPEVMDSAREAQEYNDMDHSEVNQLFVTELLDFLRTDQSFRRILDQETEVATELQRDEQGSPFLDVLDVGTGTAQIPIELCERSEEFRVMAMDLSVSMLDLARYNVEASSVGHRIELAQVDAKSMAYDRHAFDLVISNSILHHIPEPEICLSQVIRVTRPGGALFIRDLRRPNDSDVLEHLVQEYSGTSTEFCQQLFRDSLHAALTLDEVRAIVENSGFDPETVVASSDRHWTWAAFRPN